MGKSTCIDLAKAMMVQGTSLPSGFREAIEKLQAENAALVTRADEARADLAEARAVIERVRQYTSLLEAKRDRYLDAKLSDSENTHDWVISTDECANRLRAILPAPATEGGEE